MLRRGGRGGERRRREKNRRVGRGIREKRRGGWGEETLFSFSLSSYHLMDHAPLPSSSREPPYH